MVKNNFFRASEEERQEVVGKGFFDWGKKLTDVSVK